jgi:hypothetical protein
MAGFNRTRFLHGPGFVPREPDPGSPTGIRPKSRPEAYLVFQLLHTVCRAWAFLISKTTTL